MTNNNVDIFANAKPQGGEFFKFQNVGDSVQGTYIDVRRGIDGYNNPQTIYVIQDTAGKVWNVAFRDSNMIIHERMNGIRFGQIVGFRFDEHRDSKKNPGTKAKIIRVYADPKLVDQEWLARQKEIEAMYGSAKPATSAPVDDVFGFEDDEENSDIPFESPATGGGSPAAVNPQNEAITAIRNLAKTKGLTKEGMTDAEADAVIEKYAGHALKEENLTKIIIALTGYVSK